MSGRKIGLIVAGIVVLVCIVAYIDGGEEALHPIEEELELPESAG